MGRLLRQRWLQQLHCCGKPRSDKARAGARRQGHREVPSEREQAAAHESVSRRSVSEVIWRAADLGEVWEAVRSRAYAYRGDSHAFGEGEP